MKLADLAEIIQGNIPTRIEETDGIPIETITMQELNYIANLSNDVPTKKHITVRDGKFDSYSLTKKNDVIVGLSSGKSIVIEESRVHKLVLSNCAIVRINDKNKVDPYYLSWYINNNTLAIKKMQQGTYAVSIIPLSILKSFEITLLPIEKQFLIGKIYELNRKRERLTQVIELKRSDVMSQRLLKVYAEEAENGKKRI